MWHTLKLLLPALIPSWNFFDIIAPSPRIQYALLNNKGRLSDWQTFQPRPQHLSLCQMLRRLWCNPKWNESLFMMSCAERLMEFPTRHSEDEILKRLICRLRDERLLSGDEQGLQIRLLTVQREGADLIQELVYESRVVDLSSFSDRDSAK